LSWGWRDRGVLEYDEGLSRVQVNEWQNCADYAELGIIGIMRSCKLCRVTSLKLEDLWIYN